MNKNHSISTSIDAKEKIMMMILIYTVLGRNVATEIEAIIFTNISFNCVTCMPYYALNDYIGYPVSSVN